MSYIDTIKHKFVGYLAGYPVYHPLEQTTTLEEHYYGKPDFMCGPENLVIGGGSGEHPGLVVSNFERLVCSYLLDQYDDELDMLEESFSEFLLANCVENRRELEFCGWSAQHMADLIVNCSSAVNPVPFNPEVDGDVENWLISTLGGFCFWCMPELMRPSFYNELMGWFNKPNTLTITYYSNLLVEPTFVFAPPGAQPTPAVLPDISAAPSAISRTALPFDVRLSAAQKEFGANLVFSYTAKDDALAAQAGLTFLGVATDDQGGEVHVFKAKDLADAK